MQTIYDTWLWPEQMNGDLIELESLDIEVDTDVEAMVRQLFAQYDHATAVKLWQQQDDRGAPRNYCLKQWARPPQFRREPSPPDNPLGLFCADCGEYCHYREKEKRWYCGHSHA